MKNVVWSEQLAGFVKNLKKMNRNDQPEFMPSMATRLALSTAEMKAISNNMAGKTRVQLQYWA